MRVGLVKHACLAAVLLAGGTVLGARGWGSSGASRWAVAPSTVGGDFLGWEGTAPQEGRWDCGVAAAAMMLQSFRGDTTHLGEARAGTLARGRELSMLEVRSLITGGGVGVVGVRTNVAILRGLPMPVVAHLPGHFVVVDSVARDSVHVRDPARGRLRFSTKAFAESWTGNTLVTMASG